MTPRLLTKYRKEIIPAMQEKFGYKTPMAVPRIKKVLVNVGIGRVVKDAKFLDRVKQDITKITGQKPSIRKAKKSIAGFKVREGMDVGVMVTLRGKRMYDFIDRLNAIALPRSRDFRGLDSKSFDMNGNLSVGIKEHNIFPEVTYESLKDIFSLGITITTNSKTKNEGLELLKLFGFPIKSK
jgi:large subunit ribosomal protein L5